MNLIFVDLTKTKRPKEKKICSNMPICYCCREAIDCLCVFVYECFVLCSYVIASHLTNNEFIMPIYEYMSLCQINVLYCLLVCAKHNVNGFISNAKCVNINACNFVLELICQMMPMYVFLYASFYLNARE